jgi:flagellar M-ring protein FliF
MQKTLNQIKAFWMSRSLRQQMVLAAGTAATALLLGVFAHLMTAPDYKTLMTGLDPADAQTLSAALTAKQVPNKISADGHTVLVPSDKLDAARLDAAASGATHSGRMGFEIFDKVSWGETEFDEKVNYQRALEGELERTIMTIGKVKNARVHLVMAADSIFLDRQQGAKASVTLELKGAPLSRDEVAAIQRLVAGAVQGLKPTDVAVIDANTGEVMASSDGADGGADSERLLTQQILATLTPVVGAGHIRASVHVEYDPGTTDESQEKYDPAVSVPLTRQSSDEESGAGAGVGGVPGAASNVPQGKSGKPAAVPETPTSGPESSKTDDATFGVNKTVIHSEEPSGRIRRITAALLVDDATTVRQLPHGKTEEVRLQRSPEQLKQLQGLAEAAIGFDAARGDVLTIEDMPFAVPTVIAPPKPSLLDKIQLALNGFATLLRYLALLTMFALVYMFTIRPMQKQVLRMPVKLPAAPAPPALLPEPVPTTPNEDALRSKALKEELTQMVKAQPALSARTVQAWIQGETPR